MTQLAEILFPDVTDTLEDLEARFPQRLLSEGATVTRIGPSPTGFVHLGNLYNAIIAERLAHQSGGVFYLRIEDTDNKREVKGAVNTLITAMEYFGIRFDEGAVEAGDSGAYGPYRQRDRKRIYAVYAKYLVSKELAYPCFCGEEELRSIREEQKAAKANIGYYGPWARDRELDLETIRQKVSNGEPYVIRFRSGGSCTEMINAQDAIRGELTLQSNYLDIVLLKSDGIPTYHFAHVVDDHLMRTTHVVRGEEWLPSLPVHLQLFDALGWKPPVYCHTATLMKMDGTSRRKLSKRKDPELALSYYLQQGYSTQAMWVYLLTILNSNFEDWHAAKPAAPLDAFPFTLGKMSSSGALFDLMKLNDISKELICTMPAEAVWEQLAQWSERYDAGFWRVLKERNALAVRALAIGRGIEKPRKDLVNWKQACGFIAFYFDETFYVEDEYPEGIAADMRRRFIREYMGSLDFSDDKDVWFAKVSRIADGLGFASKMKDYKKHPEAYLGSIADLTTILRVALTGRRNAPDLWEVSSALGEECVRARLGAALL